MWGHKYEYVDGMWSRYNISLVLYEEDIKHLTVVSDISKQSYGVKENYTVSNIMQNWTTNNNHPVMNLANIGYN